MQIGKIAEKAIGIIKETGNYIRKARIKLDSQSISYKDDQSLVTSIDVGSEERLAKALQSLLPGSSVLAEEKHNSDPKTDFMWIIDPIDGTTNFVHNFPMYCISVALWHEGKIILGVVYDIPGDECFWAHSESGLVYRNDRAIRVSQAKTLSESLLATGFPPISFDEIDEFVEHFKFFMLNTHGIRRMGSAALDLAYVACGRLDGFFEYRLKPWDVAAGAYLVQKAGGNATDFSGGNNFLYGGEMLASNNWIHQELLKRFGTKVVNF